MQTTTATLVTFLAIFTTAAAAVPVADVFYAHGEVQARNPAGETRPIAAHAELASGETLVTGDGRAQVRFADGGTIALLPHSEFKIDNYRYAGRADGTESSFFRLLRGGLRAITGVIGKKNKATYQIATSIATIGIRGTAFTTRLCAQDCQNFQDGLYFDTTDGTAFLKNKAGEFDVPAASGAFRVDDVNSRPVQVPSMNGLANAPVGGPRPAAAETGAEQAGAEQLEDQQAFSTVAVETFQAGEQRNESGTQDVIQGQTRIGPLNGTRTSNAEPFFHAGVVAVPAVATDVSIDGFPPTSVTTDNPAVGIQKEELLTASNSDSFTDGTLFITRWSGGTYRTTGPNGTKDIALAGNQSNHYVLGTPTTGIPASGQATYSFIPGSATPSTSNSGASSGAGVQSGSLSVDFLNPNVQVNMAVSHNNATYNVNGSSGAIGQVSGAQSNAYIFGGTNFRASTSFGNCSGGCITQIEGFFAGNQSTALGNTPSHAGVAYEVQEVDPFSGAAGFQLNSVAP